MSKQSHTERTAAEPRDASLHEVTIVSITKPNARTRIIRLNIPDGAPAIRFLPGQWVDVYCPGVEKAGGFTITSPPSKAITPSSSTSADQNQKRYIELAIQQAPENPAAAYLWRDDEALLGTGLKVRVGGSFVYPPPGILPFQLRKLVFVAGGVGINPLLSMLSHLAEQPAAQLRNLEVRFLYSVQHSVEDDVGKALFVDRLVDIFAAGKLKGTLRLFLTSGGEGQGQGTENETVEIRASSTSSSDPLPVIVSRRRVHMDDLVEAIGADARFAAVYVCGVPAMTDEFVVRLTDPEGKVKMERHRVLFEKWW